MVLEEGKSKIKILADLMPACLRTKALGMACSLVHRWSSSHMPSYGEGALLCGVSFTTPLIPCIRALPSLPHPNTTTVGFMLHHMNFEEIQALSLQQTLSNHQQNHVSFIFYSKSNYYFSLPLSLCCFKPSSSLCWHIALDSNWAPPFKYYFSTVHRNKNIPL